MELLELIVWLIRVLSGDKPRGQRPPPILSRPPVMPTTAAPTTRIPGTGVPPTRLPPGRTAPPVPRRPKGRPAASIARPIFTAPVLTPTQPPPPATKTTPASTAVTTHSTPPRPRIRFTPASLRQQIVLNELLQPPLALRDRHGQ